MQSELSISYTRKHILSSYFMFLFLFSIVFYLLLNFKSKGYYLYLSALMWSPALALILIRKKVNDYDIGWRLPSNKYITLGFLIPFFYISLAYGILWATGLALFKYDYLGSLKSKMGFTGSLNSVFLIAYILLQGVLGSLSFGVNAMGEELGWRGFLVPFLLKRNSYIKTSLIIGMVWSLWHFPLFDLRTFYSEEGILHLGLFVLMVISLSFIYTKIRVQSGSIWPCILLHGAHNNFIQRIYNPFVKETSLTGFFFDETGLLIPLIVFIIALFYCGRWRRRQASLMICCIVIPLISLSQESRVNLKVFDTSAFFNLPSFEKKLESMLKDSSVGWGYQISVKGRVVYDKSGGFAITPADDPKSKGLAFTNTMRMHVASLTKTITAVAMIKKLNDLNSLSTNLLSNYLPPSWQIHKGFVTQPLSNFMLMTSGMVSLNDALSSSYDYLRQIFEKGPDTSQLSKFNYQNSSYGALRFVFEKASISNDTFKPDPSVFCYLQFVNKYLFKKAGITRVDGRDIAKHKMKMYPFPYQGQPGLLTGEGGQDTTYGDLSNYTGGLGLFLSVNEVTKFCKALFLTSKILTTKQLKELVSLNFPVGIGRSAKGEFITGSGLWIQAKEIMTYLCGLNTCYYLFPGNVLVIVFVNSYSNDIPALRRRILAAYEKSFTQVRN